MDPKALDLIRQMQTINTKYHRACDQFILVNSNLEACEKRYNRAINQKNKCFLYTYKLRRVTLTHMLHAFWHYASEMEMELNKMEVELKTQFNVDWEDYI